MLGTVKALCLGVFWTTVGGYPAGEATSSAVVLQQLVASGQAAPVGGSFDRFELAGQAIPAPTNRNRDVAFFASLVRSMADEGLFLAAGDRVSKLAAVGDLIPSGEHIADFTDRPGFALNEAGATVSSRRSPAAGRRAACS